MGWCGMRWGQVDMVRNSCGMVWDRVGIEFFLPPYKAQVKSLCMKKNGRASQSKRYIFSCQKLETKNGLRERLQQRTALRERLKVTFDNRLRPGPVQMSARRCGSRVRGGCRFWFLDEILGFMTQRHKFPAEGWPTANSAALPFARK